LEIAKLERKNIPANRPQAHILQRYNFFDEIYTLALNLWFEPLTSNLGRTLISTTLQGMSFFCINSEINFVGAGDTISFTYNYLFIFILFSENITYIYIYSHKIYFIYLKYFFNDQNIIIAIHMFKFLSHSYILHSYYIVQRRYYRELIIIFGLLNDLN
jgi:hypothetical protein